MILKICRKILQLFIPDKNYGRNMKMIIDSDYANREITKYISSGDPFCLSRFGSNELNVVLTYVSSKKRRDLKFILNYLVGREYNYRYSSKTSRLINEVAGVFPKSRKMLDIMSNTYINSMSNIDILASWRIEEKYVYGFMKSMKTILPLESVEPFFSKNPWTTELANKKVLVVSPFSEQIKAQYAKRHKIHCNGLLPDFELVTYTSVLSAGGSTVNHSDWRSALDFMKDEISLLDFDIAILGCGAYGLPLATHIKDIGRQALHLGGSTQLLFGIVGARWLDRGIKFYPYRNLMNEFWIRPVVDSASFNAKKMENGAYF